MDTFNHIHISFSLAWANKVNNILKGSREKFEEWPSEGLSRSGQWLKYILVIEATFLKERPCWSKEMTKLVCSWESDFRIVVVINQDIFQTQMTSDWLLSVTYFSISAFYYKKLMIFNDLYYTNYHPQKYWYDLGGETLSYLIE